jgi:hypothetical protein
MDQRSGSRRITNTELDDADEQVGQEVPVSPSLPILTLPANGRPGIDKQISNMLAATKALKPADESLQSESSSGSRKPWNNVLSKMKNAIGGKHLEGSRKKQARASKLERLLSADAKMQPAYEEEAYALSTMEMRMNEGDLTPMYQPVIR